MPLIAPFPVVYSFPPTLSATYAIQLKLDGDIPVFGGIQGTAQADVAIGLKGVAADAQGAQQTSYSLQDIKVLFNGAPFPLDVDSARAFFPTTTISVDPLGKVLKSNAPDIRMPVRLPGLDPKRFPEGTFLSVEWPADGVEVGKKWTVKKPVGDTEVTIELETIKMEGGLAEVDTKLAESFDNLEDAARAIPVDPKTATAKVHTEVVGKGHLTFDIKKGLLKESALDLDSTSTITPIAAGAPSTRKLKTHVGVSLTSVNGNTEISAPSPAKPASKVEQLKALAKLYWQLAVVQSGPVVASARAYIGRLIAQIQAEISRQS